MTAIAALMHSIARQKNANLKTFERCLFKL